MKAIIDEIDRQLLTLNVNMKAYGLCIPVVKGTQVHPVRVEDSKQVAIDDKWDVQYFHRLLPGTVTEDEEFSFGARYERRHVQMIRTVVITKKKLGFDWIETFIRKIPQFLKCAEILTEYKFVNLTEPMQINPDQDAIYNAEFGPAGDQYEKHRIPYIIYALEYGADFIKCAVVCS